MFVFRKIWRALFSWSTSFEIRTFANNGKIQSFWIFITLITLFITLIFIIRIILLFWISPFITHKGIQLVERLIVQIMFFYNLSKNGRNLWMTKILLAIGAVLMDLFKAFDCIPPNLLVTKLHAYGLSINAIKFIYSYIKRRK